MPNFNGAIIMHTLQLIKTPATLREIVVAIAKNTELPQEDLMKPVKQTLDMGHRLGFLQKVNGRYFLVAMTFETLMSEMKSLSQPIANQSDGNDLKLDAKPKVEKRTLKKQLKQLEITKKNIQQKQQMASRVIDHESTTTLIPTQSLLPQKAEALLRRKSKRSSQPTK
ncbi:hypothetical protein ACLKA6_002218 [Drosophila palustris]